MNFSKTLRDIFVCLGMSAFAAQVGAVAISDTGFETIADTYAHSSAVALGKRGATRVKMNELTGLFEGAGWGQLDTLNRDSKVFQGVTFTIDGTQWKRSGDLNISWSGATENLVMDLMVVTKGGIQWAAYLFESVDIGMGPHARAGTFEIGFASQRGFVPSLRNAAIFGRVYATPTGDDGPEGPYAGDVPVPGSLPLLLLGLGLTYLGNRTRNRG